MAGMVAAVVVAAGRGLRAGGDLPKQYRRSAGRAGAPAEPCDCSPGMPASSRRAAGHPSRRRGALPSAAAAGLELLPPVPGGATRQASVRAGLEALRARQPRHRAGPRRGAAVRVAGADLARDRRRGASTAPPFRRCAVTDTVKTVDADGARHRDARPRASAHRADAAGLRVSRPCSTRIDARWPAGRDDFTDDAALAEWAGIKVVDVRGRGRQREAHHQRGFRPRRDAPKLAALSDVRTGHRLRRACRSATAITSCSAACASRTTRGLSGHSDADVVLHALVDAILGALADGDIGAHFPPSDPQWRGASSDRFLAFAVERVRERGGRIAHLDVTIVCEAPRIGPHRDAMRARIAEIAGIADRAGRRQGDHQREARLHRPRRRHRGVCRPPPSGCRGAD